MSEEYKYTNDNKKVIIVGKLNSQQTIVQEIFISNGNEIPSGENFIVSSLHDTPIESWKDKDLKKREANYKIRTDRMNNDLDRLDKEYNKKKNTLRALINKMNVPESFDEEPFKTIIQFLVGEITHVIIVKYSEYKIVTFEDMLSLDNRYDSDKLKLLTLFGKKGCGFEWNMNIYSDGSGANIRIYPYTSFEEARESLNEIVRDDVNKSKTDRNKSGLSDGRIEAKEKYGLEYPLNEDIKIYYTEKMNSFKQLIKKNKETNLTYKDRNKEFEKIIEELNNES